MHDALGGPGPVAVRALADAGGALAVLERRLDAAERAVVGAPQRGVERRVGLPVAAVEAVPVVRPVAVHGQQVPGDAGHRRFQVAHQGTVGRAADRPALAVEQAADLREVGARRRQGAAQLHQGGQPLAAGHEIGLLFAEGAFRQRRDMASRKKHRLGGVRFLDGAHGVADRRHDLRRGRGLVAVGDHGHEARLEVGHAVGHLGGRRFLRLGVDDGHGEAVPAGVGGHQAGPHRVLDGRERGTQRLVHLRPAGRVDEDEVDLGVHGRVTRWPGC